MEHTRKRTKNMQRAVDRMPTSKKRSVSEAIVLLKQVEFVKFDSTVELSLKLGVDAKQSSQMVRGVVALPSGTGKSIRVAVVSRDQELARSAGADIVGADDLIAEIADGNIHFDLCIASPNMMGSMGKIARILGPRGLMPNPKLGTVTSDIVTAVKKAKAGQVEFRSDKGGNINSRVGKLSFTSEGIIENIAALWSAVLKAKPAGVKGEYIRSVSLCATMSPAVALDISDVMLQADSLASVSNLEKV
jgi:large subunit ribosomal protein L1